MAGPKYLTGDKAGIHEFLDKFDVRQLYSSNHPPSLTRSTQVFLFDCDGTDMHMQQLSRQLLMTE